MSNKTGNVVKHILALVIIFGLGEACFHILREMNESNLRRALDYLIYNFAAVLVLVLALALIWYLLALILSIVTARKLVKPGNTGFFVWSEVVMTVLFFHLVFWLYGGTMKGFNPRALILPLIAWIVLSISFLLFLNRPVVIRVFRRLGTFLAACILILSVSIVGYNHFTNRAEKPVDVDTSKPNVLLITIDTLRADALSCYGYSGLSSPYIDRLASEGVLFKNAFSPSSWTYPSMASLMTSLPPPAHAIDGSSLSIRASYTTIAEVLNAKGYYTGAVVGHPVLNSKNGYSQGFRYFDVIDNDLPSRYLAVRMTNLFLTRAMKWRPSILERSLIPVLSFADDRFFYFKAKLYSSAEEITAEAEKFLEDSRDTPFFLHLHYFDPHGPYHTHPKVRLPDYSLETQQMLPMSHQLYQAEIMYCDRYIGKLVNSLEEMNLRDKTYIILTGDHGEAFLEHEFFFHGNNLHIEEVKIPLIITGPGIPHERVIDTPVTLTDLAPTIAELIDIEQPDAFMGSSLVDLIQGTSEEERMAFALVLYNPLRQAKHLAEHERRKAIRQARQTFTVDPRNVSGSLLSVRTKDFSFLCMTGSGEEGSTSMEQLYDIKADPLEKTDVSERYIEEVNLLREALLHWYNDNRSQHWQDKPSPQDAEKLRALGYIF
jgi:arylsulfatase A-like enzyme